MNLQHRHHAIKTLIEKYKSNFQFFWNNRKTLGAPEKLRHELEFLPTALALQETPVSPAPRIALWVMIGFVCLLILWMLIGKIDIVVTAQGKIIPNDKVKVIQPLETATVKQILVADGQEVKTGASLIELDSTVTYADVARLTSEYTVALLQSARAEGFLTALEANANIALLGNSKEMIPHHAVFSEQRLLDAEYVEYLDKKNNFEAEIVHRQAEEKTILVSIEKLKKTVPLITKQAFDYKNFLGKHYVSKHAYYEKEQLRLEAERDLAVHLSRLDEIKTAIAAIKQKQTVLFSETKRIVLDKLQESNQKIASLKQELLKAKQRNRLMRLTAPVDGTVQQLAVHTIGGVVTSAQILMVVVPKEHPLEAEVFIENKDIGFVYVAQKAEVKIEAFPYTKHGTLAGDVKHLSMDAISDEKMGLVYSARIRLSKQKMRIEQKHIPLTPGMAVTAEIKTGRRRIIEYFLSPLLQYQSESLKER